MAEVERSQRAVPMPTRAARALARHAQETHYGTDDDLVFPRPFKGSYLSDLTMPDRFAKALASAGVRPARFHDLRPTYGTLMAASGTPLRTLQGLLMGHASYSTSERYAKWAPNLTGKLAFAERAFAVGEQAHAVVA